MVGYDNFALLLRIINIGRSRKLCDNRKSLRLSCLKQLFDTRKTLCDIVTGNASGMERTHGQLGTRLSDRLGSDDADSLSHLYRLSGRHIGSVALRADAAVGSAGEDGTNLDLGQWLAFFIHALLHNEFRALRRNHMVCLHQNVSILIYDILAQVASCNTLLQAFNLFIAIHECFYIHSRKFGSLFYAVDFMDDQFLGYVNQTPGQVSGIGCTQGRI